MKATTHSLSAVTLPVTVTLAILLLVPWVGAAAAAGAGAGAAVAGGRRSLTAPSWSRNCDAPYDRCAAIDVFEDWESGKGSVKTFLNARYPDPESSVTVWYVTDHYGSRVDNLREQAGVNLVRVYLRGSERTSPALTCERKDLDAYCQPTKACAEALAKSGTRLGNFSIEHSARDLDFAINSLNGKTRAVVIGEGMGAAVAIRYMKNNANNTVAVMLVNPVNPETYNHFEAAWQGYDLVMQRLLAMCDAHRHCSARLGATEGAWYRMQNILAAAAAGHLPCQENLGWGKGAAFGLAVRMQLAAMLVPPFAALGPADRNLVSLIPAFLYRLQRCNAADVAALKHLRERTIDKKTESCSSEAPLRHLWLANELTPEVHKSGGKGAPAADALRKLAQSTRSVVPVEEHFSTFAAFYQAIPKYARTPGPVALYTKSKLLLVQADLDPLLPMTQANQLLLTYGDGNTVARYPSNGAMHLSGSTGLYDCIIENLKQYARNGQWAEESACRSIPENNANGIDFIDCDPSLYFGDKDAWGFTVANEAEPPGGRVTPTPGTGSKAWRGFKTFLKIVMWMIILAVVGALLYVGYVRWSRRAAPRQVSDDFFDNLHR